MTKYSKYFRLDDLINLSYVQRHLYGWHINIEPFKNSIGKPDTTERINKNNTSSSNLFFLLLWQMLNSRKYTIPIGVRECTRNMPS